MVTRNLTCEAIGTFALTFIGAGAILTTTWTGGDPGLVGIAIAHGLVLAIAVSATMNISGGHINPAVTVVMLVTGRIGFGSAIGYIIAQCAGATVAGFLLSHIFLKRLERITWRIVVGALMIAGGVVLVTMNTIASD